MRRFAAERFEEDRAERVDARAVGDMLLGGRLLGGRVVRRAERESRLGHAAAGGGAHGEGAPEVRDDGAAVAEEDALAPDVAVDHALPVGVLKRVGDFGCDADGVVDPELLLAGELVAERLAGCRARLVEEPLTGALRGCGATAVVPREDVRVLELGGGLDLLQEAVGAEDGC